MAMGREGTTAAPPHATSLEELIERARALARSGPRRLLGIAGAPGAGKSHLATAIARALGPEASVVAMDGFHLANGELARLGRRERKGAPDTFDGAGYVALLRRLREPGTETVYAPRFEREIEEPVAAAVAVEPAVRLVVTEGNYLLVDSPPWAAVRPLLDETWFCDLDDELRVHRLVARHEAYGKSSEEARAWALGSDERNTRMVAVTRSRADLVVRLAGAAP